MFEPGGVMGRGEETTPLGAATAASTPVNHPFVLSVEGLRGLPGARSAAVLAAYAYQGHDDLLCARSAGASAVAAGPAAGSVERFTAARRLEGWAVWLQVVEAARLAAYWQAHPFDERDPEVGDCRPEAFEYVNATEAADPALHERLTAELNRVQARTPWAVGAAELADDYAAAEFALASGLTRPKADGIVTAARVLLLGGDYPRVTALLRGGFLDASKLQVLVTQLPSLGPVVGPAVERALIPESDLAVLDQPAGLEVLADPARPGHQLPAVTRMSIGRLNAAITAHATALDAEGAAERARQARAKRQVWTRQDPDGMARLEAVAGTEDIQAVWNSLTGAARRARRHGDKRTLDQLRLDELVRRAIGATGSPGGVGQARPPAPAGADATESASPACDAPETPDRRLCLNLTMPLETFLGLAHDPCALDGYGAVPAGLARQIAADAMRDHPGTTTWRCIITGGGHGTILGLTRRAPVQSSDRAGGHPKAGGGVIADPGPVSTTEHDPPARLVELMRVAFPRCVFPGCGVPAARCDLDHRVPYDHATPSVGGPTCSCNLQPTCRTHHRLKTIGLVTVEPVHAVEAVEPPDPLRGLGVLRWTSRAGYTYTYTPEPVTHPGKHEAAEALREELHAVRSRDADWIRRANEGLAAARDRARLEHNLTRLREHPDLLETWTETIERPLPDHPVGWPRLAELDADDPYALLPLPPLTDPDDIDDEADHEADHEADDEAAVNRSASPARAA